MLNSGYALEMPEKLFLKNRGSWAITIKLGKENTQQDLKTTEIALYERGSFQNGEKKIFFWFIFLFVCFGKKRKGRWKAAKTRHLLQVFSQVLGTF